MKKDTFALLVALVAVITAIGGYFYPAPRAVSGALTGETNYNTIGVSGLKVGSGCNNSFGSTAANGCKSTTHLIATTCELVGVGTSQAASSTQPYDCAVTGVTSSDAVFAQLATSTIRSTGLWWNIVAAKASTTAGSVTVELQNLTGAAAAPGSTGVGSSTSIYIFQ